MIVAFSLIFTEIGYGATIFKIIAPLHEWYQVTSWVVGSLLCLLYILDFRFWSPGAVSSFTQLLLGAGLFCLAIFTFRDRPYSPLVVVYVGTPLIYMFFYLRVFSKAHISNFMISVGGVFIVWGIICFFGAMMWMTANSFWWGKGTQAVMRARLNMCNDVDSDNFTDWSTLGNGATKLEYDNLFGFNDEDSNATVREERWERCRMTNETYCTSYGIALFAEPSGQMCCCHAAKQSADSVCDPGEDSCLAAFMLWGAPVMGSVVLLLFGGICQIMAASVSEVQHDGDMGEGTKVLVYFLGLGLLGVYVAASLAGASMRIAELVKVFSILTIGMSVMFIGGSVGWESLESELSKNPIIHKLEGAVGSDLFKAIGVITMAPVFLAYCIISLINQALRKSLPCTAQHMEENPEEKKLMMTKLGTNIVEHLQKWHWAKVLSKVVWVGFIYFVFSVGVGRLTTLGLSALNDALSESGVPMVTLIYFIVGWTMFMLPPVPGVPVYLTGGVVVAQTASVEFGSFPLAVIYASFCACAVKAAAIFGQQKVIGGMLGAKVGVRQTVGVNSITIRAIRMILQEKGLNGKKIAILVGGPDWPTSVLTGILKQSYVNMIVGSAPFIVTIPMTVRLSFACRLLDILPAPTETIAGTGAGWGAAAQGEGEPVERCRSRHDAHACVDHAGSVHAARHGGHREDLQGAARCDHRRNPSGCKSCSCRHFCLLAVCSGAGCGGAGRRGPGSRRDTAEGQGEV